MRDDKEPNTDRIICEWFLELAGMPLTSNHIADHSTHTYCVAYYGASPSRCVTLTSGTHGVRMVLQALDRTDIRDCGDRGDPEVLDRVAEQYRLWCHYL